MFVLLRSNRSDCFNVGNVKKFDRVCYFAEYFRFIFVYLLFLFIRRSFSNQFLAIRQIFIISCQNFSRLTLGKGLLEHLQTFQHFGAILMQPILKKFPFLSLSTDGVLQFLIIQRSVSFVPWSREEMCDGFSHRMAKISLSLINAACIVMNHYTFRGLCQISVLLSLVIVLAL